MKLTAIGTAVLGLSCGVLAGQALAQNQNPFPFTEFSATVSTVMPGQTSTSRIARSGDKMRAEIPGSGGKQYSILLLDQHKVYVVMAPGVCMVMSDMAETASSPLWGSPQGKVERKELGTATVNGHPAKIEQVTITPDKGGKPTTMKVWVATDLKGFPVRTEMQTSRGLVRADYTNISLSPPDSSLFATPQNCHPMGSGDIPASGSEYKPPAWAADIASASVVVPPYQREMSAGEIVRVKLRAGQKLDVRCKDADDDTQFVAVPFKDGQPTEDLGPDTDSMGKKRPGAAVTDHFDAAPAGGEEVVVRVNKGNALIRAVLRGS